MDFGKVATNPLVWVIGGGVGLVVLLSRGASGGTAPQGVTGMTGPELSAQTEYNRLAFDSVKSQAAGAVELGKAAYSADIAKQASLLGYMTSLSNNRAVIQSQQIQANTGIAQSQIASSTAITLDIMNNSNRLQMAWVEADTSKYLSDNALEGTKYQARYAAKGAKYGAIGSVVGKAMDIGMAYVTGGTSVAAKGLTQGARG